LDTTGSGILRPQGPIRRMHDINAHSNVIGDGIDTA